MVNIKTKKMKKLSILTTTLLPVLVICYNGVSQVTEEWTARYNGPDNKNDQARLIATDGSGNVIVSGTSGSKKGGFAFITTVKYNPVNGTQQYVARYSGPSNTAGNEYPYALAVDNAGNIYVTGRSMGGGSNVDIVTIKYNSSLVQQWVARFNGPGNLNDIPGDIKVDASGNVYVTGLTGADNPLNTNGAAIVTLKYNNSLGTMQPGFPVYYDGAAGNQEQGVSLDLDGNGNIYVTGKSEGMVTIKYTPSGLFMWSRTISNATGRRVLIDAANNVLVSGWGGKISKYDTDGTPIWQTNASLPEISFWDMALDGTGNVYVTGTYNGVSANHSDYVTAKYNFNDGTEEWIRTYNGPRSDIDIARSIALDGSGNVYITGYTSVNDGTRNGGVNYGTVKYDNNGEQQWVDVYDGLDKYGGHAFGVAADAAGNVYVTGESANKTNIDFGTVKYSLGAAPSKSMITVPTPEIAINFQLKNFPNPFNGNTTIEYQLPKEGKVRLTVFDLSGHEIATLVNEYKTAGVHKVNFGVNKLSAGTYFYKIQFEEMIQTRKLVIIK